MIRLPRIRTIHWPYIVSLGFVACSLQVPDESDVFSSSADGGRDSDGGSSSSKGGKSQTAGGGPGAGGTTIATSGGSNGVAGEGGVLNAGGSASGGLLTSGGSSAMGGASAAGGALSSGGSSGSGGATAKGGTTTTGGVSSSGGNGAGGTTIAPPPPPPPSTVILKYDFDVSTDTVATDTGGTTTPHHGTLSNVALSTTGRNLGGAVLSAGNSEVVIPPGLLAQKDSVSVSAWVKMTVNAAGNRLFTFGNGTTSYLYLTFNDLPAVPGAGGTGSGGAGGSAGSAGKAGSAGSDYAGAAGAGDAGAGGTSSGGAGSGGAASGAAGAGNTESGGISLRFLAPGGIEQVLTTKTELPIGVWKHIAVTSYVGGTSLYIDGKIAAYSRTVAAIPSQMGATTGDYVGNAGTGIHAFQGQIDEFHLYEGVLSRNEIIALAAPQRDYSIYHFDEGSGTTVADASSNPKNGTVVGGATWVNSLFGTALKLHNTTPGPAVQYVDLADGVMSDCTTNFTVAGWLNLETNLSNASFLDVSADLNGYLRFTTNYKNSNDLTFQFNYSAGGTTRSVRIARTWSFGQWYHLAWVRRASAAGLAGNSMDVYLNGALLLATDGVSTATSIASFGTTVMNYFGKSRDDVTTDYPGLDGMIDEILISCRSYTADEIAHLAYRP